MYTTVRAILLLALFRAALGQSFTPTTGCSPDCGTHGACVVGSSGNPVCSCYSGYTTAPRGRGTFHDETTLATFPSGVPSPSYKTVVIWEDYDGDDQKDFLMLSDSLVVFRQVDGAFQDSTSTAFPFSSDPNSTVLLDGFSEGSAILSDINSDGLIDVVVMDGTRFYLFFQDSSNTGTFEIVTGTGAFPNGPPPGLARGGISLASANADGHIDFMLVGYSETEERPRAVIYQQNPLGVFTDATADMFLNDPPLGVVDGMTAWADYDNDGRQDFLLIGQSESGEYITNLYRQHTPGRYIDVTDEAFGGSPPPGVQEASAAWQDYDGDGRADFILAGLSRNAPWDLPISRLYRQSGTGEFVDATSKAFPGQTLLNLGYSALVWTDLDSDGLADLVISGLDQTNTGHTRVYSQTGLGVFEDTTTGYFPDGVEALSAGFISASDYDGDELPDLLITGSVWPSTTNNVFKIYRQHPSTVPTPCAVGPTAVCMANTPNASDTDSYPPRLIDFKFAGDKLLFGFYGPFIANRELTNITISRLNGEQCGYPSGALIPSWTKPLLTDENHMYPCQDYWRGEMEWNVAEDCGWDLDNSTYETVEIYKAQVVIEHLDNLGYLRENKITRTTNYVFGITVLFDTGLMLDEAQVSVFAPIDITAFVIRHSYDYPTDSGLIDVLMTVQWPFQLLGFEAIRWPMDATPVPMEVMAQDITSESPVASCEDNAACTHVVRLNIDPKSACTLSGEYMIEFSVLCRDDPALNSCLIYHNGTEYDMSNYRGHVTLSISSEDFCIDTDILGEMNSFAKVSDEGSTMFDLPQTEFQLNETAVFRAQVTPVSMFTVIMRYISLVNIWLEYYDRSGSGPNPFILMINRVPAEGTNMNVRELDSGEDWVSFEFSLQDVLPEGHHPNVTVWALLEVSFSHTMTKRYIAVRAERARPGGDGSSIQMVQHPVEGDRMSGHNLHQERQIRDTSLSTVITWLHPNDTDLCVVDPTLPGCNDASSEWVAPTEVVPIIGDPISPGEDETEDLGSELIDVITIIGIGGSVVVGCIGILILVVILILIIMFCTSCCIWALLFVRRDKRRRRREESSSTSESESEDSSADSRSPITKKRRVSRESTPRGPRSNPDKLHRSSNTPRGSRSNPDKLHRSSNRDNHGRKLKATQQSRRKMSEQARFDGLDKIWDW